MNMSDNVKLMLRESQAELFKYVLVSGYDFRDFVEKYMNSNFVQQEMDSDYSFYQTEFPLQILEELLTETDIKKKINPEEEIDELAAEFFGDTYKLIQLETNLPSKIIFSKIPIDRMVQLEKKCNNVIDQYEDEDILEYVLDIIFSDSKEEIEKL